MTHAATPEAAKLQRARRKARRLAAGQCLYGLCCPLPVERAKGKRSGPALHSYCPLHRTAAGRRGKR